MNAIFKKDWWQVYLSKTRLLFFIFTLSLLIMIFENCQDDARLKNISIADSRIYSFVIDSPIVRKNQVQLLPIRNYDEIIRLRNYDSWGMFDLICNIYPGTNKRIELIRQVPFSSSNGVVRYQFLQKELSDSIWREIVLMYEKLKIKDFPIDLEPNRGLTDGGLFSIARKDRELLNCTTWQLMSFDNRDSIYAEQKKNAISFYNKVMSLTDYPKPKIIGIIDTISRDSFKYLIGLDDYTMVKSVEYSYDKWRIKPSYEVNQSVPFYFKFSDSIDYAKEISASIEYFNQEKIVVKGCEIRNK